MYLAPDEHARADLIIAILLVLRHRSDFTEEEIANRLEFDSAEQLYAQLLQWSLPHWLVYGPRTRDGLVATTSRAQAQSEHRLARQSGEALELPPAERAAGLFSDLAEKVAEETRTLEGWVERLRAGRFEAFIRKEDFGLIGTGEGAAALPAEPLVRLIGMYGLTDQPMAPLLEALHPDPGQVDEAELETRRAKLKIAAGQLARIVRSAAVQKGRLPADLSDNELWIACNITYDRRRGIDDEEIYNELRLRRLLDSRDDFERLGSLGIEFPR